MNDHDAAMNEFRDRSASAPMADASMADDQRRAVTYGEFLARCSICGEPGTQFCVGDESAFHASCLAAEWRKRVLRVADTAVGLLPRRFANYRGSPVVPCCALGAASSGSERADRPFQSGRSARRIKQLRLTT